MSAEDLFVVPGPFGRSYTLANPCGSWCTIGDWASWVRKVQERRRDLDVAQADLAAQSLPPIDPGPWDAAWDREPQTISDLTKEPYRGDAKAAIGRVAALGKQLAALLDQADARITSSGGVSRQPTPTTPVPRPTTTPGGLLSGLGSSLFGLAVVALIGVAVFRDGKGDDDA